MIRSSSRLLLTACGVFLWVLAIPAEAAAPPVRQVGTAAAGATPVSRPPANAVKPQKPASSGATTNAEWHNVGKDPSAGGQYRVTDGSKSIYFLTEKAANKAEKQLTKATGGADGTGKKGGKGNKGGGKGNGVVDNGDGDCGPDSKVLC